MTSKQQNVAKKENRLINESAQIYSFPSTVFSIRQKEWSDVDIKISSTM